jgi:hypothetical protein
MPAHMHHAILNCMALCIQQPFHPKHSPSSSQIPTPFLTHGCNGATQSCNPTCCKNSCFNLPRYCLQLDATSCTLSPIVATSCTNLITPRLQHLLHFLPCSSPVPTCPTCSLYSNIQLASYVNYCPNTALSHRVLTHDVKTQCPRRLCESQPQLACEPPLFTNHVISRTVTTTSLICSSETAMCASKTICHRLALPFSTKKAPRDASPHSGHDQ